MDDLISPDVREFIIRHVDTVSQLEALLLLRAHQGQTWDLESVANRVYASVGEIAEVLERFSREGFLIREGDAYRYKCDDPAVAQTIGRLAALYASHLIPVTNLIHGKPRAFRSFADAFKLRKDN